MPSGFPAAEIEREPLCRVEYCPAPDDAGDWHACIVCKRPDIEHHHGKGRGKTRTLDKRYVFALCREHHDLITRHVWTQGFLPASVTLDECEHYFILNLRGETVVEIALPPEQVAENAPPSFRALADPPPLLPALGVSRDGHRTVGLEGSNPADRSGAGRESPSLLTPSGLAPLPDSLPYDEWYEIGRTLAGIRQAVQWAIGDWIRFGEAHYGEKYSQGIDLFDLSYERLRNITGTVDAFDNVPRAVHLRERVPFAVFEELAPIARSAPEEAEKWLLRAEAESLTRDDIRAALRPSETVKKLERMVQCPHCGGEFAL